MSRLFVLQSWRSAAQAGGAEQRATKRLENNSSPVPGFDTLFSGCANWEAVGELAQNDCNASEAAGGSVPPGAL